MRWFLALLLVSLLFAYSGGQGQGGYGDSGGGQPTPKQMRVQVISACEGNVVYITYRQEPLERVRVFVKDARSNLEIAQGRTDSEGKFVFNGCGKEVVISASKEGFFSQTTKALLVDCGQCQPPCQSDLDCPQGYYCGDEQGARFYATAAPQSSGRCLPQPQCESDKDCAQGYVCREVEKEGKQKRYCAPPPCNEQWDCSQQEYCESQQQPSRTPTLSQSYSFSGNWCNQNPLCNEDSDCPEGQKCGQNGCYYPQCQSDEECQSGICYQGRCVPQPQCQTSEECKPGFMCDQGKCVRQECEEDSQCGQGVCVQGKCAECRVDSDCRGDSVCDLSQGLGFCREAQYTITCGKERAKVGEVVECKVLREGEPCGNCEVLYTNAAGESKSVETDEEGRLTLNMEQAGSYKVRAGGASAEVVAEEERSEAEAEGRAPQLPQEVLWGLVVLVILGGLFWLWRRGAIS